MGRAEWKWEGFKINILTLSSGHFAIIKHPFYLFLFQLNHYTRKPACSLSQCCIGRFDHQTHHLALSRCSPLSHLFVRFLTLAEIKESGQIADHHFKGTLQIKGFDFKCGRLITATSKVCAPYPLVEGIHLVLVSRYSWWVIYCAVWASWRAFLYEWMDSLFVHQQCPALRVLQDTKKKRTVTAIANKSYS